MANVNNNVVVTIEARKANEKVNLTYTVGKSGTVNLTGNAISCDGLVIRGQDVSHAVRGKLTVMMSEAQGTELAQYTEEIYTNRESNSDFNPALSFTITCKKVQVLDGSFLIRAEDLLDITVDEDFEAEMDVDMFLAKAASIQESTKIANAQALEQATERKRQTRVELTNSIVANMTGVAKQFVPPVRKAK